MQKELASQYEDTATLLFNVLSLYTDEQFNAVPFEGSWTAGQVTEHIYKFQSGLPVLFSGDTKPADRDPAEKVEMLRGIFLDFNTKLKSPAFIEPSDGAHNKAELIAGLMNTNKEITDGIQNYDLNNICMGFDTTFFGTLTRLEWISFVIVHTQRHIHQLENIHQRLVN